LDEILFRLITTFDEVPPYFRTRLPISTTFVASISIAFAKPWC